SASFAPQPAPRMVAVTSPTSRDAATLRTSVDLRLGRRRGAFEEIEIAALIGLRDVALIERAVTALVARLGFLPGRAAACKLRGGHLKPELACRDVELDRIAVLHQCERTADEGLRRDV